MTHPTSRRLRVTVLMGGDSSERPVSLSTGRMIVGALDPDRYEVSAIDTRDLPRLAAAGPQALEAARSSETLQPSNTASVACREPTEISGAAATDTARPDLVFIALHGKGGEDGTVQGMLEMLGLPYTGSGVLASALAMDKSMTKRLLSAEGIGVIEALQARRGQPAEEMIGEVERRLGGFPVFVKPNAEGSTFGCSLVEAAEALSAAVERALALDPVALIERYVRGVEITVGVLGNAGATLEALPVIEIVPRAAFYDYESKYADGGSEHIIPARLPEALLRNARETALRCHELLGCRGMSRTDMIVADGLLYVLEINTIPGMTPTSLLPQAAAHAGISFSHLLDRLIADALR